MSRIAIAVIACFTFSMLGCGNGDDDVPVNSDVLQPPTTTPPVVDNPKKIDTQEPVVEPKVIAEEKKDDPDPVGELDIGGLPVPEGQILYISGGDKNGTYLMNADGTNRRKLFDTAHEYPVLSPDMLMIAYTEGQAERQIFVKTVDGNRVFQLTGANMNTAMHPDWSPDGEKIAFSNDWNIFVMKANGLNIVQITPGEDNVSRRSNPSWSPDGLRIAYVDSEGTEFNTQVNDNIHAIKVDGTNRIRLTNNPAFEDYPDWSFDGDYIAYNSHRDGNFGVFVVNVRTFEETQLTDGQAEYRYPTWSPDSEQIAFSSNRDGNREIHVINKDGTGLANITNSPRSDEWHPDWR